MSPDFSIRSTGPLVLLLLAAGCAVPEAAGPSTPTTARDSIAPTTYSEPELRDALRAFADRFSDEVRFAANQIAQETESRAVRKQALLWKSRVMMRSLELPYEPDPLRALVDAWVLAIQQQQFLTTGDGKAVFLEHQPIAIAAADRLVADIEATARGTVLGPDQFERTKSEVLAFARDNPVTGGFQLGDVTAPKSAKAPGMFTSVLGIPLAPFRPLSGIDVGGQALRDLATEADRLNSIVEELPETSRWQLELLMYNLEETETVRSLRQSTEEVARASIDLNATIAEFPGRARSEAAALLDDFDRRQPELRATISEIRAGLAESGDVLKAADEVSARLTEAGRAWDQAAASVDRVFARFDEEPAPGTDAAPAPAADDEPGFDETVRDMTAAADAIRAAAAEIRSLLDSDAFDQRMARLDDTGRGLIDHAAQRTAGVTDALLIRQLILVAAIFACVVIYRLIFGRSARRATG